MKKIHVLVGLALAGAFTAAQAIPVDFSGYARGGYGVNTDGGRQTCISLKDVRKVQTHYRLGTECDYTLELNLNATLAKNTDGSEWHVNFMLGNWKYWSMQAPEGGQNAGGPSVDFKQAWAYGQNLPMLAGGTIWAGRRFYNRFQLGINDHFITNDDGDGFGVDNINLGGGVKLNAGIVSDKLSGSDEQSTNFMQKYIVSVTDIPTFAGSKLQARLKVNKQSKQDERTGYANGVVTSKATAENKGGYEFAVIHETPNVLNGTFTAGLRLQKNTDVDKATLLFAQQSGSFGKVAYDAVTEYQIYKADDGTKYKWFSVGGRLDTQISGPLRGIAELGYDTVNSNQDGAKTYNLMHLTLAAAFSSGAESWSRPTVRLYYTYNKWNSAVRDDGALYGNIWKLDNTRRAAYAGRTSGSAVGAQWEAWW